MPSTSTVIRCSGFEILYPLVIPNSPYDTFIYFAPDRSVQRSFIPVSIGMYGYKLTGLYNAFTFTLSRLEG